MAFSEKALECLKKNYFARNKQGDLIENSPEELMTRIARAIFPDDHELCIELYDALMAKEIIFNSPVMFNIGLPTKQILAACWVGDLRDSMESILEAGKVTGLIFKYGSGMGLPLTKLRPKNDVVSNSGFASGPVSFMELYDAFGKVIKSGGKRRAAFMSMNDVHHPDIEDIILAKKNATGELGGQFLENMNISIALTDEFMQAVKNNDAYELRFKDKHYAWNDAASVFNMMAECAWQSGDPGVFFIDTANKVNPLPGYSPIFSTNPCGEQPLHPWTCCNLAHINATALTTLHGDTWVLDYEKAVRLAKLLTYALDRIIDIMDYPSDSFRNGTLATRPIGVGYTGLAEVLYRLKIPYSNSQKFVREFTHLITSSVIEASIELADMFGTSKVIMNNIEVIADLVLKYTGDSDLHHATLESGIRNSTWTTLAPTGTTSLAVDAYSYGLEPHFGLVYRKNFINQFEDKIDKAEYYVNDEFRRSIRHLNIDEEKLLKDIAANHGSCQKLTYIPEEIRRVFEVAHDLTAKQHLQICAAAQAHLSSAISKTINLPNEATVDDVKEVYFTAWELGLKGATIYRDGSKDFQPIDFSDEKTIQQFSKLPRGVSIPRGDTSGGGDIDAWRTACTKMYVIPGYSKEYKDVLIETFLSKKSGGGCDSNLKAIALLVSLALRKGVQVKDIEDELFSITCTHCVAAKQSGRDINALSCPQAIARTLRKQGGVASNYEYCVPVPGGNRETKSPRRNRSTPSPGSPNPISGGVGDATCGSCGAKTIIASGCSTCPNCGDGGCDHGRE